MSAPDLSSLGQGASDVLSSFGFVIPAVLLLLLAWATYRTGSTHLLLSRVWLLIFGKLDVSDQAIESFLAKRDAFMKFRLVTGLKPRTLEQAKALIAWCDEHKEDVGDVKACGHFFDVERLQLRDRLPGRWVTLSFAVLALVFFTVFYMSLAFAVFLPAAFHVKATENWYLVDDGVAERPRLFGGSDVYRLELADCKERSRAPIPEADAAVLCQLMGKEAVAFRSTALSGQRFILSVIALVGAWLWIGLVLIQSQIKASKAMSVRLSG